MKLHTRPASEDWLGRRPWRDRRMLGKGSLSAGSDRHMKSPGGACLWGSVSRDQPEVTLKRHVAVRPLWPGSGASNGSNRPNCLRAG